ncbi:MAG: hypothetical protein RDV48_26100 [Candidatus Eremiobacteraeota bacterium]|nr:hypothetical protein [Candidatus Eremiobacteraeota bacterium]
MDFLNKMKWNLRNTIDEVKLNVKHNQLAVERRSILSEIGMLYIRKGKNLGFSDAEIEELVKKVVMLSTEIKVVGKQLKMNEEVDFSAIQGSNAVTTKFNQAMMKITQSSEKYDLKGRYDSLVEKAVEALAGVGHMCMCAKNKNFEALPEYREIIKRFEMVHAEYSKTGKELRETQVLAREKSEWLIPFLTFLYSLKEFAGSKKRN